MNKSAVWKYAWLEKLTAQKTGMESWNYLLGFGLLASGVLGLVGSKGETFTKAVDLALKAIEAGDKTPIKEPTLWEPATTEPEPWEPPTEKRRIYNPRGVNGYWRGYYTAFACAHYSEEARRWASIPDSLLSPDDRLSETETAEDRAKLAQNLTALCEEAIDKVFALVPGLEKRMKRDALGEPTRKVKVGLHLEGQKFGQKPKNGMTLFDQAYANMTDEERRAIEAYQIEVIGLDSLTKPQRRALFAVQFLLSKTDYQGNTTGKQIADKGYRFTGVLPRLTVSLSEYYEAYRLEKTMTERGYMEFSGREIEEAREALLSLGNTRFLFHYSRKVVPQEGPEPRFNVIRRASPIFVVEEVDHYRNVTSEENSRLKTGDSTAAAGKKVLDGFTITVMPIMVDQHETFFMLKDADYLKEIQAHARKASVKVELFIDWLLYQAHRHRRGNRSWNWELPADPDTLKYTLKMDSMIKARQTARIRGIINQAKQTALELGYLEAFTDTTVKLNPDKFLRLFETSSVQKMIEKKGEEAQNGA